MGLKVSNNIPHLITAQERPFYELEKHIIDNRVKIEAWFREAWLDTSFILTSSVDIRNAGFKISAVDTNLFPAGFNNLNPDFYSLCIQAAQSTLYELYPYCKKILIIPESHTRNPHYYQSVATLTDILQKAGYEVKIGSLLAKEEPLEIALYSQAPLILHPIQKKEDKIVSDHFTPCLIILNNDLSEGIPPILQNISQPIEPPPTLGWSYRSKTHHFTLFQGICQEFAQLIDIDMWQIFPYFMDCDDIDFLQKDGINCLVKKSDELLMQIQKKYNQYEIKHKPFIVIKADAGTYGIAVMTLRDPQELMSLNRKQRISMSVTKGGRSVNKVILQEGVYTFERMGVEQAVAEPVVYMIGQHVIGGFYRVHKTRNIDENLNAPGMHFEKLAFAQCCNNPDNRHNQHLVQNQFYVYSVIARLALLASCKEKKSQT